MNGHVDPVRTETEFINRLDELVESARQNNVEIEGGWSAQPPADSLNYEVLISAVVRPPK